jgi:hypothetical protein
VTEIMTKPITVKSIEGKVRSILEQPRPFVDATQYFGPDRRRRGDDEGPRDDRRRARRTIIKQVSEDESIKKAPTDGNATEAGEG